MGPGPTSCTLNATGLPTSLELILSLYFAVPWSQWNVAAQEAQKQKSYHHAKEKEVRDQRGEGEQLHMDRVHIFLP